MTWLIRISRSSTTPARTKQWIAVRFCNYEVAMRSQANLSTDHVGNDGDSLSGNLEPQRAPGLAIEATVSAKAVVARRRVRLRPLQHYLARAVTGVQITFDQSSSRAAW